MRTDRRRVDRHPECSAGVPPAFRAGVPRRRSAGARVRADCRQLDADLRERAPVGGEVLPAAQHEAVEGGGRGGRLREPRAVVQRVGEARQRTEVGRRAVAEHLPERHAVAPHVALRPELALQALRRAPGAARGAQGASRARTRSRTHVGHATVIDVTSALPLILPPPPPPPPPLVSLFSIYFASSHLYCISSCIAINYPGGILLTYYTGGTLW